MSVTNDPRGLSPYNSCYSKMLPTLPDGGPGPRESLPDGLYDTILVAIGQASMCWDSVGDFITGDALQAGDWLASEIAKAFSSGANGFDTSPTYSITVRPCDTKNCDAALELERLEDYLEENWSGLAHLIELGSAVDMAIHIMRAHKDS